LMGGELFAILPLLTRPCGAVSNLTMDKSQRRCIKTSASP
jgi:hypothetical protein